MENIRGKLVITLIRDLDDEGAENLKVLEFKLYKRICEEMRKAILETINYNSSRLKSGNKLCKSGLGNSNKSYIAPLERSNIFAFIGERGTGKTTAVNEFCKLLENHRHYVKFWEEKNLKENIAAEDKQFYTLPPIDASVLGDEEDLIEVILASMYQDFQRLKNKETRNQDIFEERIIYDFDQAYREYISVGGYEKQANLGETMLVKLNGVSNSLKTRVAFNTLIEHFLEYMCGEEYKETYLAITIDDLDMNPKSGYKMLEQLHKYLENLRVVVLVAVRYEQVRIMCQKYFLDSMMPKGGKKLREVYVNFRKEARKIGDDYLLKVLPVSNRVYLPEKEQLYLNGLVKYENSKDKALPVKEFILRKIAIKMNIFYDAKGLKKHFCLPDTVRELVTYVAFLDSLLSVKEIEEQSGANKKKLIYLYDENYERFNNDIEKRMALELLNDDQWRVYRLIRERNIERRARYTINFTRPWIVDEEHIGSGIFLPDRSDESNYCYADLLERLYCLGRENYEDKVLVHCILASFTSEMVREYYRYQNIADEKVRDEAEKRLNCFRGKTFGGEWFDRVLPKMVLGETEVEIGISEETGGGYKEILQIKKRETVNMGEWLVDILPKVVPYIECLSLFLYNIRDDIEELDTDRWKFEICEGNNISGETGSLVILYDIKEIGFDFLGFIGKELDKKSSKNYGSSLHQRLVDNMCLFMDKYLRTQGLNSGQITKVIKQMKKDAKKNSIWDSSEFEGQAIARKAVFPYYNLDMSYNIMKRVRRKILVTTRMQAENICEYFREIYGYIGQCLHEEKIYYEESNKFSSDKISCSLDDNFIESPFIKAFGIKFVDTSKESAKNIYEVEQKGELNAEKSNISLNDMLVNLIKSMSVSITSEMEKQIMVV